MELTEALSSLLPSWFRVRAQRQGKGGKDFHVDVSQHINYKIFKDPLKFEVTASILRQIHLFHDNTRRNANVVLPD